MHLCRPMAQFFISEWLSFDQRGNIILSDSNHVLTHCLVRTAQTINIETFYSDGQGYELVNVGQSFHLKTSVGHDLFLKNDLVRYFN